MLQPRTEGKYQFAYDKQYDGAYSRSEGAGAPPTCVRFARPSNPPPRQNPTASSMFGSALQCAPWRSAIAHCQ